MPGRALWITALLVAHMGVTGSVGAQQSGGTLDQSLGRGSVVSPILTIDSERLFLDSAFGKRVARDVEAKGAELAAENRQIETDLEAEERQLTDMRATMAADEFRALANAFDEKVQRTRAAQAAKGRALNALLEEEREVFLNAAAPVLEQLMREADAAVILERRTVFISDTGIEVTDDAIELLNETLGSGPGATQP